MGGSWEAWLCPEPGSLQEQPLGTTFSLSEPQHSRLERRLCQNLDNIGQSLKWIVFGPAIALLGLYPRRTHEHLLKNTQYSTGCSDQIA